MISARFVDRDPYGRSVAIVYLGQTCVNAEMVKAGLAWHFHRFSDSSELAELQQAARSGSVGLWSDRYPTPPWEFRHAGRPP